MVRDLHDVLLGGLVHVARDDVDALGFDGDDLAHLQIRRRDRGAVDQHAPHAVPIGGHHETVTDPIGGPGHHLDPRVVPVLGDDPRGERGRVCREHLRRALVS